MLIKRLLSSLSSASSTPPADTAPVARGAERLAGDRWLVRGRHGVFVGSERDIYIGRALIEYGEYGELEWQLLERFCGPGDTVVEVGANIGTHTVAFAKRVGPAGRVVAIEPQAPIFQMLCANVSLNALRNVDARHCGCGGTSRVMRVPPVPYGSDYNFGSVALEPDGGEDRGERVEVRPLDELLDGAKRVDLVKIDVEGMERDVLAGAARTIERFHPRLYVENDRVETSSALIAMLDGLGYRMWWHTPWLYNPANYFGNDRDLYPRVMSVNMLCLHATDARTAVEGLREVTDAAWHPVQ